MPNGVKALGARYENILRDLRGGLTSLSGVIEYEGFASLMGESRIPWVAFQPITRKLEPIMT